MVPAATRTGAMSGLCARVAPASKLMEHRTAAKEWRMGWAFLPQKNASNTIIVILRGEAVNAQRGMRGECFNAPSDMPPSQKCTYAHASLKIKTLRALLSYSSNKTFLPF